MTAHATVRRPNTSSETTEGEPLAIEEVFEVLRNERRREVLTYLRDSGGTTTVGEVAEHVAAGETDQPVAQLSSRERKRVYVGLYQYHLPKMDSMSVVAFERRRGRIEVAEGFEQVQPYLRGATGDVARPHWYLGIAVPTSALVALGLAIGADAVVSLALWVSVLGLPVAGITDWYLSTVGDPEG
jgi:hypothetical protein